MAFQRCSSGGGSMPELNNIQTWLRLGGVTGSYATMQDILADTAALNKLMTSGGAVNYLVGCDDFITEICASSNGMSAIGASNYCANSLLPHSNWCEGIANSEYIDSVLNIKVPTMTSNTTPSGQCLASSSYSSFSAWKAFDGDDTSISSQWESNYNDRTSGEYVGYQFTKNVKIFYAKVIAYSTATASAYTQTLRIENSLDGNTWSPISNDFDLLMPTESVSKTTQKMINVDVAKKYFRIYLVSATRGIRFTIRTLQLYGREDV